MIDNYKTRRKYPVGDFAVLLGTFEMGKNCMWTCITRSKFHNSRDTRNRWLPDYVMKIIKLSWNFSKNLRWPFQKITRYLAPNKPVCCNGKKLTWVQKRAWLRFRKQVWSLLTVIVVYYCPVYTYLACIADYCDKLRRKSTKRCFHNSSLDNIYDQNSSDWWKSVNE